MNNGFNTQIMDKPGYQEIVCDGTTVTVLKIKGQQPRIIIESSNLIQDVVRDEELSPRPARSGKLHYEFLILNGESHDRILDTRQLAT